MTLFEVIAIRRDGQAVGVTFTDEAQADKFADLMQTLGYDVDPYPEYEPAPNAQAGLKIAAAIFGDERLKIAARTTHH